MKVAVIGVGSMGQNHARIYSTLDTVELVAVADANLKTAELVAKRYNCKAYDNYINLLHNEEIDALSIAVPTNLHREVALEVLNKKKHVLLEKPIATSEQEAMEIINCAQKNNVKLMIGHIERFNSAIIEMKKRLGELGEIYKIDVQRIGPFPPRITDVGVIIDLSVHDLDIISYLINLYPTKIYAETQKKLHPLHEDSVIALLKYGNEIIATLNVNYLSPTKIRQLQIFGKRGMFQVNYLDQDLYFYENLGYSSDNWSSVIEGDIKKINIHKKEPLLAEIESFCECIKNNTPPPVSGEEGLNALKFAHQLIKSAHEKKIIENN